MSYSIVQSAVNPPTQTTATAFFSATNDRTFGIRISVTANGATIIPSTLINVGGFLDGNAAATGLFPGNTYAFVMTIRRNSNNEQLGTRTVNISTLSAPPPEPPSWSSNFPSGQVGSGYSGSATATFPSGGTWGFLTAPSIPGLSLSQGLSSFSLSGTPTVAGTYSFSARASDEFGQNIDASFSITISAAPPPTGTVPDVRGDIESTARSRISTAGFNPVADTATTSGATSGNSGTVASQNPGGASVRDLGTNVFYSLFNFVVPTGTVPDVRGDSESTARSRISTAGFNPVLGASTTSGATSGNNGQVASQVPSGGQTANLNSNVTISLFNFVPPNVSVPNVVGQTQAQATSTLQGAGFGVTTTVTTAGANSANNGTVASQDPAAGSSVAPGTSVTISIFTFNPPVWTDNVIVNNFVLGTSYSDSVSATNSPSYSISSGTLPAGISLNSVTGAITGTPTASGQYSFVISATNSFGSVSVSYNGDITAVPAWSDQTLADFSQGRTYSDGVVATNSPSYSVSAGTLPVGISLNSATGAVTGTPTGTGAYNFTIRAANSFGAITANFTGSIKLPPNWIDNQLGSFINGVAYSDSVAASNSPTYSVSTGTLPAGISLASSTGVLSGTPTGSVGTNFSFTITATNAEGSISQAFTGSIQPDLGGNLKLFANGAWSDKEVYVYDGTTWVRGTVHIFSGTAWAKSVF